MANRLYQEAQPVADPDDLRVLNGLYIDELAARPQEGSGRDAFGKLVELGLELKQLPIKLLFNPGTTTFYQSADLQAQYAVWLAVAGAQAGRTPGLPARRRPHQPHRQRRRQRACCRSSAPRSIKKMLEQRQPQARRRS